MNMLLTADLLFGAAVGSCIFYLLFICMSRQLVDILAVDDIL